jgi:hypothetical protein
LIERKEEGTLNMQESRAWLLISSNWIPIPHNWDWLFNEHCSEK